MTLSKEVWRESAANLGCLFVVIAGALCFQRAWIREERLRRLTQLRAPIVFLIQQAHRQKDDLGLQQAVQALAAAPGVRFAAVLGPDDQILAHSDERLVGKKLESWYETTGCALKENHHLWGRLIFSDSEAYLKRTSLLALYFVLGGAGITLLVVLVNAARGVARVDKLKFQKNELRLQLSRETAKSKQEAQRAGQQQLLVKYWLMKALEKVEEPLLLLDNYQRVMAISAKMERMLKNSISIEYVNKSWQDIPKLKELGVAIQESLRAPENIISVRIPDDAMNFTLQTWRLPDGTIAGTCIGCESDESRVWNHPAIIR